MAARPGLALARAEGAEGEKARAGIGYRPALTSWIDTRPVEIQCLEIIAEQFYMGGRARARSLSSTYPLVVHTSRLSLGTPGTLNRQELEWLVALTREVDPLWVSDHVGFRRSAEVDLGHPTPIPFDRETLSVFTDHCREVMDRCGKLLLVENIASPLTISPVMSEPEFLNRLCEASGCGLLLDVTGLVVNSRTHGFDAHSWLALLEPGHIVQLHLGGVGSGDDLWLDTRGGDIDDEVWTLAADVLTRAPVRAVVLERDERFPPMRHLAAELQRVSRLVHDCEVDRTGRGHTDP